MFNRLRPISATRLFLAGAIGLTLWLGATFLWHVTYRQGISLAVILFLDQDFPALLGGLRSEEHTSEIQSLMRISYAVFCLKKKRSRIRRYITIYKNHHPLNKSLQQQQSTTTR